MMRYWRECLVVLGLGVVAPAYSADDPNAASALVEIRIVQLNGPAPEAAAGGEARAAAVEPETIRDARTRETSYYVAPLGRDLLIGGQVLPASRGQVGTTQPVAVAMAAEDGDVVSKRSADGKPAASAQEMRTADGNSPWTELSAPRIVSRVGQAAAIDVGANVPYMEKRRDGSFVLEQGEPEGLHVDLQVGEATAASVRIDRLEVRLTQLIGREPISDVPFDIGKPRYRTRQMRIALRISPDQVAIIPLPVEQERVFILVTARLVPAQP